MHLLVIGASGRTGKLVVKEALARGHTVTALVRKPESLQEREGLRIVQGSPLNREEVDTAMGDLNGDAPRAVVVTLNATRASESPFAKPLAPPRFMADSVANIRESMKSHAVRKLVIMSAFGVGDSFPNLNFLMRPVIRYTNMAAQFEDHDLVDKETKESGLDWVLVRPAMLKGETALPVNDLGDTGKDSKFMPSISRASVARFLVDAAEKENYNGRTPVICN